MTDLDDILGPPVAAYSDERMRWAVQNACFAADSVAIGFAGTQAEKTRAVIERALEALVVNGMIEIKDPDEWPGIFAVDKRFL